MGNIAHQNMSMTWGQVCSAQNRTKTAEDLIREIGTQINDHEEASSAGADIILTGNEAFNLYTLAGVRPPNYINPNSEIYVLPHNTVCDLRDKLKAKLPQFRQRGLHIV